MCSDSLTVGTSTCIGNRYVHRSGRKVVMHKTNVQNFVNRSLEEKKKVKR